MTASGELQVLDEAAGPQRYKCSQGVIFVKRARDPRSGKILQLSRPVGCQVHCTGQIWTGPSGGQWAELDVSKAGDAGWVLVSGPGFGLSGPALIDADSDDLLQIRVHLLDEDERKAGIIWEGLVPKTMTVRVLKKTMCSATGLDAKFCCMSKDMPAMSSRGIRLGADYMPELADERVLGDCGLAEDTTMLLVYVGDLPGDLDVRPAAPPEPTVSMSEKVAGLVK